MSDNTMSIVISKSLSDGFNIWVFSKSWPVDHFITWHMIFFHLLLCFSSIIRFQKSPLIHPLSWANTICSELGKWAFSLAFCWDFSSRSSRTLHGLNAGGLAVPHLKAFTDIERRVPRGGWCFLGAPSRCWSSLGCRQHPGSILPTVLPCPLPSCAPRSMGEDWEWVGTPVRAPRHSHS